LKGKRGKKKQNDEEAPVEAESKLSIWELESEKEKMLTTLANILELDLSRSSYTLLFIFFIDLISRFLFSRNCCFFFYDLDYGYFPNLKNPLSIYFQNWLFSY
jgi:hypothetical protein